MHPALPPVFAHRGASARAPENTLPAFQAALEAGVPGIELDVQLTADGVPVVLHDESVDRTTDGEGAAAAFTLEELQRLDAGTWFDPAFAGTRVPTLSEVLDLVDHRAFLDVELKTGFVDYPGIEETVGDLLVEADLLEQVIVTSFNPETVRTFRDAVPTAFTGVIIWGPLDAGEAEDHVDIADALALDARHLDDGTLDLLREHGYLGLAWHVEDAAQGRELRKAGWDAVILDDPAPLVADLDVGTGASGP